MQICVVCVDFVAFFGCICQFYNISACWFYFLPFTMGYERMLCKRSNALHTDVVDSIPFFTRFYVDGILCISNSFGIFMANHKNNVLSVNVYFYSLVMYNVCCVYTMQQQQTKYTRTQHLLATIAVHTT